MSSEVADVDLGEYKYGFHDEENPVIKIERGLNEDVIRQISAHKGEPEWMLDFRLEAYKIFLSKPMPNWGSDLSGIDFENIFYYLKPTEHNARSWDDVPDTIKNTFERLGIPEAERKFLAGVGAQYESEVIYHSLKKELEDQGILFLDTDQALLQHEDIFREYFGTIIPSADNKFSALNSAVWSGGSFIYVPPGVRIEQPLQAYFRINAENMGQFERTLIIVDEGAYVHYVEGCTAPTYSSDSLHSAVVEILVKKGGRCRYTTIQNWSNNVYNLVTKRAVAEEDATMEWVDGNLGSKVTMKYPSIFLVGEHAHEHDDAVGSLALVEERPMDLEKLGRWLSDLVAERGPDLFRMKGIIQLQGEARRYVFQSVHMLIDGDFDRPWKVAEPRRTEFVIIGRDLDAEALRASFLACVA